MRILYVYDGDWPRGAIRVHKETRSLARGGHEVVLVCRNDTRAPRRIREPWMEVERLPSVAWQPLNRLLNFPYFFNPVWARAILGAGRRHAADLVIVADLPLAPTALWAARRLGVPAVFDMAEVYPLFLESMWEFEEMGWTDHLVRNPRVAAWLERRVLPGFARVIVVSEESGARARSLGIPAERIVVVGNTPENVAELASPLPMPADLRPYADRPRVLFVGTLIGDRGVTDVVRAMPGIVAAEPRALLVIVGDGQERARIEQAIGELGLADHVVLLGWKAHADLTAYYQHCDVGLNPLRDSIHVRVTLANKLFDYMGAGLPVVATDLPSTSRILKETGAGLSFRPGDPAAMAAAVVRLLRDSALRRELGENGRRAVAGRYSWAHDERRLLASLPSRDALPAVEGAPNLHV